LAREIIKKYPEYSTEIPSAKGNYIIVSVIKDPARVSPGPLWQEGLLSTGYYLYCGSAHGPGGLRSRIGYHTKVKPKKHWHFDRLRDHLDLVEVWWNTSEKNHECIFSQCLQRHERSDVPLHGFGSSDCLNGCASHLIRFPLIISLDALFHFIREQGNSLNRTNLKIFQ